MTFETLNHNEDWSHYFPFLLDSQLKAELQVSGISLNGTSKVTMLEPRRLGFSVLLEERIIFFKRIPKSTLNIFIEYIQPGHGNFATITGDIGGQKIEFDDNDLRIVSDPNKRKRIIDPSHDTKNGDLRFDMIVLKDEDGEEYIELKDVRGLKFSNVTVKIWQQRPEVQPKQYS